MANFTILLYEDDEDWKDGFDFAIRDKILSQGKTLNLIHRFDADSIDQDLMCLADLIMIDHDLGEITGQEIIQHLDGDTDYNGVSIFYYSGGETIDDLISRASKFKCHISCYTKTDPDLHKAILSLVGTNHI